MSIARVYTVQRANKDQGKCEKDGTLLPKGSAYRWWTKGFRSRYKHVRCMKPTCTPRPSELESSLLASVYAAQEDAQPRLSALYSDVVDNADELTQALQEILEDVAAATDDVVQQYRDQDEQFGGGGNTDSAERADTLEAAAEALREWQPDGEPDACEAHDEIGQQPGCDDCQRALESWRDDAVNSAEQALAEMEV